MQLKFKIQQFQTDAVNSVVDLFKGQEKQNSIFTIEYESQSNLIDNGLGLGNALNISDLDIIKNMNEVQKRNTLPTTNDIEKRNFCIEMETGTGKTYVYTKTIFELNKQYGFTKFIIVVPSVAIREGAHKSLEVTKEHFANQYDNVPYNYFIYDSKKLNSVRSFAVSNNIEIMIINIDAFKKSENIINQEHDKLNGETAMSYIRGTSPIVIIDEPQSVDNTDKSKEAIANLNPMCTLRYSATHKEKMNVLYRLTPVDAYQMGIVKQIVVSSNQVENSFNKPYIRLISVSNENGFSAYIEVDKAMKNGKVDRKRFKVKQGSDVYAITGERELYEGYVVAGIDCTTDFECIEFANGEFLALGKAMGDIDENIVKRAQIKRTIETHLDKELRFQEKGIKVLSLFFIDRVEKYRLEDGSMGVYAEMFEECYNELMALPKFEVLKDKFPTDVVSVHDGYFSQDKKGKYKNTKGDTLADHDTYNTIMKDKEWLLSFDCPLRFIFSHSTLKEGWDNPNVFQICTLIEQKSTFTARQKVGRGLRLCVNQDGERVEEKNTNILHVIANESFTEFASNLQKEIENETGVKFGIIQLGLFSGLTYEEDIIEQKTVSQNEAKQLIDYMSYMGIIEDEKEKPKETVELASELEPVKQSVIQAIMSSNAKYKEEIGEIITNNTFTTVVKKEKTISYDDEKELINHFENKGYTDKNGKIKDTLKNDLKNGTLDLPKKFESAREKLEKIINSANKSIPIRDSAKEVTVKLKKEVMLSPKFLELWDKIKQRTTYRVKIDDELLKEGCIEKLKMLPEIPKPVVTTRTADINVAISGVSHREVGLKTMAMKEQEFKIPDFLRMVDEECFLCQKNYIEMLFQSGRAKDFLNNPQLMTERFIETIKRVQNNMEIDGISYKKLDGEEYYLQEIFEAEELIANLDINAVPVEHSVYDYVIYDSKTVERPFAVKLDDDEEVEMFFKIPDQFKIETPIGTYNPDWAVYLNRNGEKKLYFILETKGTTIIDDLRGKEQLKIKCGQKHFEALDNNVELKVAKDWFEFKKANM